MHHHNIKDYLEIGSKVFGDKWTVTLTEDGDFLLDVLYVILRLLQINYFNGHNLLSPFINAFKNFPERAFSYFVQLGKELLWVSFEILCKRDENGEKN